MIALPPAEDAALPRLRDDLVIHEVGPDERGHPQWRLSDPIRQRHYILPDRDIRLLAKWHQAAHGRALVELLQRDGQACSQEDLASLLEFLRSHHLLMVETEEQSTTLLQIHQRQRAGGLKRLLGLYLGWKRPLVRPAAFLQAWLPLVRMLASPLAVGLWLILSAFGLLLVSRQWDHFTATLVEFISWKSLVIYGIAMSMLKCLHELGHAFAAAHHGCKVPTMGVMVSMGLPMLYTDTSDAVKLQSRRARMSIGAAGMAVELWLAGISLLIWAATPIGPINTVAFVVATSSLITSLIINLNPLGKFDGYYILCDALGMENLQTRALSLAGWRLRGLLLGVDEPAPEHFKPRQARRMMVYGIACWFYRVSIYLGIATAIWMMGFKQLALAPVLLCLYLQVWLPWRQWRQNGPPLRSLISRGRYLFLMLALGISMTLLFAPLDRHTEAVAVMRSHEETFLRVPAAAEVLEVRVSEGQAVKQGMVLATLRAPELDHQKALSTLRLGLTELRLRRVVADPKDLDQVTILSRQYQEYLSELEATKAKLSQLTLKASGQGLARDVSDQLKPGSWVRADQSLVRIVSQAGISVAAYVSLDDMHRLEAGARAWFIGSSLKADRVELVVEQLERVAAEQLQPRWIASPEGGPIDARKDDKDRYIPTQPIYMVRLRPIGSGFAQQSALTQELGHIIIESRPESLIARSIRHVRRLWRTPA